MIQTVKTDIKQIGGSDPVIYPGYQKEEAYLGI